METTTKIHCEVCKRKVFFNRSDFLKAHNANSNDHIPNSPWVYKKVESNIVDGIALISHHLFVCRSCEVRRPPHQPNCLYYREPIKATPQPEIFNWDNFWKHWFGVLELDFDSQRFFGKY